MAKQAITSETRHRLAREARGALAHGGHDHIRLRVRCESSHHVATVYGTAEGPVVVTRLRAHSHGDRDRFDAPHGEREAEEWVDLLAAEDPGVDDAVPAWCDCGHRLLSRRAMLGWLSEGERLVIVG